MKFLNTKINLLGMTVFLLVTALLVGFSSVISTAAASLSIDETTTTTATEDNGDTTTATDNMSLNANATSIASTTVELTEEPFAVGHYREVSNMTDETQEQFSFEGSTTITLPNATEMITTRDTGQGTFSLFPGGGGGTVHGQIHITTEDGSETATVEFNEFVRFESPTGIGIAYFSTNSTGILAPLNNMIAVFLDEVQPNEDSIARFFEWEMNSGGGGAPMGSSNNSTTTN